MQDGEPSAAQRLVDGDRHPLEMVEAIGGRAAIEEYDGLVAEVQDSEADVFCLFGDA